MGAMRYCESLHLLKHRFEHTCTFAIRQLTLILLTMTQNLQFYISGVQLVPSGLPRTWTLVFEHDSRPFPFSYKCYMARKKTELCECSLSAGSNYLAQTNGNVQ